MFIYDGLYINIHEAALVDYACMHLNLDDKNIYKSQKAIVYRINTKSMTSFEQKVNAFAAGKIFL